MRSSILRHDVFPFICQNSACQRQYDIEGFIEVLNLWGLVYADCGDQVYQGITCTAPKCKQTNLLRLPREMPLVDLRDFIITPNPNDHWNTVEQVYNELVHKDNLPFKWIPAWDTETVSLEDVKRFYYQDLVNFDSHTKTNGFYQIQGIPYKMTHEGVHRRLKEENRTGKVRLRRVYPDVPKFRNLLTCLNHPRIAHVEFLEDGQAYTDCVGSSQHTRETRRAWLELISEAARQSLEASDKAHLKSHGYDFNVDDFTRGLHLHSWKWGYEGRDKLIRLSENVGFEETVLEHVKEVSREFFHPIATETALASKRTELSGWVEKIKKGQALFVDAPMGLGKTHSIVEALVKNLNLSAVIFMPTNKLCEEIVEKLKTRIAMEKPGGYGELWKNMEFVEAGTGFNEDAFPLHQKGLPLFRLKRKFLKKEVYFADGINKEDCPHFKEIVERYRDNWMKKSDFCDSCTEEALCRFIRHKTTAPLSRIVITTHSQYDLFRGLTSLRKWFKYGYARKKEAVPRDVFIVDEDLVLSRCYQPICLYPKEVRAFSATVTTFLERYENTQPLREKIHALFGQIKQCDKTAIVRPLDPKFKIPWKIVKDWKDSLPEQQMFVPETLDWTDTVGNHLELIKNAIRVGLVVQRYKGRNRIYLNNPKTYNLSKLPPHVFFDGTMLDTELLQHRLKGVQFERFPVPVQPLWELNVWQNVNTDLPKKWIRRDKEKAKSFLRSLLNQLKREKHRYFFVATKATRTKYLSAFLDDEFPRLDPAVVHYGNFRGINDASDCDVGIMLGSYVLSDAVEIAMALNLIQDHLPERQLVAPYPHLWTWQESKGRRHYKEEYEIVERLAASLRLYEHRQAIARTRHLFHDVDFYVLSKDPVNEYERVAQVQDLQYRADLFPPRRERPDSEYESIRQEVSQRIEKHGWVTITELHDKTKHSRTTLRTHFKRMLGEKFLTCETKGREIRYSFPSVINESAK